MNKRTDNNSNNSHDRGAFARTFAPGIAERRRSLTAKPRPPARVQAWVHARTLSVPDVGRLKNEWEQYQKNAQTLANGRMQIDLLNIRTDKPLKRPVMRVRMGSAQYFTSRSRSPTGDWNEGFIFVVSYHSQLFDTIDFDLYDKPRKHWPAKTRHVGKAKLKLSSLKGKDDIFVTFLPIYEYHAHRSLPEDVRDTLINTELINIAEATGRLSHAKLIGSVQLRIRYHYQSPTDVPVPNPPGLPTLQEHETGYCYNRTESNASVRDIGPGWLVAVPYPRRISSRPDIDDHPNTDGGKSNDEEQGAASRRSSADTIFNNRQPSHDTRFVTASQHGHGELAQDEHLVDSVFRDRLTTIMSTHVPGTEPRSQAKHGDKRTSRSSRATSSTSTFSSGSKTAVDQSRHPRHLRSLCGRIRKWLKPPIKAPSSARGRRFGFSQNDSDDNFWGLPSDHTVPPRPDHEKESLRRRDRIKQGASRHARWIIDSVNFGDKNFATQWMKDSFEDVALSHPAFDRLVGFVVSHQTRALVRSVIKLANAFGQGFKVTSFRLLKAMIVLQAYYKTLPRPVPGPKIQDASLIDEACHYFGYALIAYGWRGLCYLGAYGKYIREAHRRRSNKTAIIHYLKIHPEDLLGYEYGLRKGAVFQPSYFVAVDRSRRAIVLSIRGTWSLYDAITDLVCEYRPFKGGLVHSGMLASAQWFYTNIVPQIFRYVYHHRHELSAFIITGHSLGGGTASLLTMLVSDQIGELRKLAENPSFRLHCYSYAPVASSSSELSNKYDSYIHSFICQDDIVGRMSYGTATGLKELVMDTISACDALGGWYKVMTDPQKRKICFDIITQRREQIFHSANQLYPLLYIPGNIVYIQRIREYRFKGRDQTSKPARTSTSISFSFKKPPLRTRAKSKAKQMSEKLPGATRTRFMAHAGSHSISNEMFITKSCIEDHMLASYQRAFDQLRATYSQP